MAAWKFSRVKLNTIVKKFPNLFLNKKMFISISIKIITNLSNLRVHKELWTEFFTTNKWKEFTSENIKISKGLNESFSL